MDDAGEGAEVGEERDGAAHARRADGIDVARVREQRRRFDEHARIDVCKCELEAWQS